MKPTQAAALILLLTSVDVSARASDWSYCLAPAEADNRIYLSQPFPAGSVKAEGEFNDLLAQRRLRHDSVQCPRTGDEASAIVMRQHAIDLNRSWGRQVVDTPLRALP